MEAASSDKYKIFDFNRVHLRFLIHGSKHAKAYTLCSHSINETISLG